MTARRQPLFVIGAVGFLVGGLYHAAALFRPTWAEPAPPWRHAVFILINLGAAAGLVLRPRLFPLLFAVLTAQQLYSHGGYGWKVWRQERRVDWGSVVVLTAMPALLALILRDEEARQLPR